MLVLTRKAGEGLWIGKDVHVLVSRVNGGQVRVCIQAPESVTVLRDELKRKEEECGGTTSQDC